MILPAPLRDLDRAHQRCESSGLGPIEARRDAVEKAGAIRVAAARGIQGRVQELLLDVVPVVTGRTCLPIRWMDGQVADRDEETLRSVFDQVDVYGWSSVPTS